MCGLSNANFGEGNGKYIGPIAEFPTNSGV
jgi:hypothetical protein